MSLMRLLKTGQALNEIKGCGRYRLPKGRFTLPTFGQAKKTAVVEARVTEVKATAPDRPPVAMAAAQLPSAPASKPALKKVMPQFGWLKRSNPFATRDRKS